MGLMGQAAWGEAEVPLLMNKSTSTLKLPIKSNSDLLRMIDAAKVIFQGHKTNAAGVLTFAERMEGPVWPY